MNEFRRLFQPQIYRRGYDYYQDGCVLDLSVDDDIVSAVVDGTTTYDVTIYFNNGKIEDMSCDCPYAMDGHNCKHMAATLIQLSEENLIPTSRSYKKVTKIFHNEWEKIIYKYFEDNPQGFINRHNVSSLDRELTQYFNDTIMKSYANEKWENLFNSLYEMLANCNLINATVSLTDTLKTLDDLLQKLQDSKVASHSRKWLQNSLSTTKRLDFLRILLKYSFAYDQEGIQELNKTIKEFHQQKNYQSASYCLKLKIEIMKRLKYTNQDIYDSVLTYKNYAVVKDFEIICDIESGRYTLAREKIHAFMNISSMREDKRNQLRQQLMDVNLLMKDYQNYIVQAIDLCNTNNELAAYLQKMLNSVKNENERKKVITIMCTVLDKYFEKDYFIDILIRLKLYDMAFYEIYESGSIRLLLENENSLIGYDPQTYYYIFYKNMIAEMQAATSYTQVDYIAYILKGYKDDKEYKMVLYDILDYANEHLHNKRLLMESLNDLY